MNEAVQPKKEQPSPTNQEAAHSFTSFIAMLEDGQLHHDLSEALRDLNAKMNDHAVNSGKAKGKLSLNIDFTLNKGVFDITSDFKVKEPQESRARSVAWSTQGNNFTPHNPRQMNLFGQPRDVTSQSREDIRGV